MLAFGTSLLSSLGLGTSASMTATAMGAGALERARHLSAQLPDRANASTTGGEADGHAWWSDNEELFEAARVEYGVLHRSLYDFEHHVADFIQPHLLAAIEDCERAAATGGRVDEEALRGLLLPAGAPNVWRLPLLTERFCSLLLEELRHYEASGIPLRRPNGMNRYGAILDQLGLDRSLDYLSRRFLRPLGQMLYPWLIGQGDADEHYGFIVRYKPGEDVSLAEHADASVLTLNANLGIRGFTGGSLAFRGTRWVDAKPQSMPESTVTFDDFAPGEAILHLGGQYHSAYPIESGERANLIVWLHGAHEVVRFAARDESEQLAAEQRWAEFATERTHQRFAGRIKEIAGHGSCTEDSREL